MFQSQQYMLADVSTLKHKIICRSAESKSSVDMFRKIFNETYNLLIITNDQVIFYF